MLSSSDEPLDVSGARLDILRFITSGEIRSPRTDTADKLFRTNTGQCRQKAAWRHRGRATHCTTMGGCCNCSGSCGAGGREAVSQINSVVRGPGHQSFAANVTDPAVAATSAPSTCPVVAAPLQLSADLSVFTDQLQFSARYRVVEARRGKEALAWRLMFERCCCWASITTSVYANRWQLPRRHRHGCPARHADPRRHRRCHHEAGPASGYGNCAEAADGTITMYGHTSSSVCRARRAARHRHMMPPPWSAVRAFPPDPTSTSGGSRTATPRSIRHPGLPATASGCRLPG